MSTHSTNPIELLDFLAEKFLQKGKSISYINLDDTPALRVTSDNEEQIFLSFSFSEANFPPLPKDVKVLIPVLNKEEENQLLKILPVWDEKNIQIYHLSLLDRYSFLNRQFLEKQLAV